MDQTATSLSEKDDSVSQKIHVAVYYEALCPDSRSFVLKQLDPTYRKLLINMEIELVPYGKAKVRKFVATKTRITVINHVILSSNATKYITREKAR